MPHRISPQAESELDAIWDYIARQSGNADIADRFVASLTDRFYLLSLSPYLGRRRDDDLRPGMRSFPVGQYIILYRVEKEDVLILHVVRDSRNLEALFGYQR
jgi:toxin ParE1/3/4